MEVYAFERASGEYRSRKC
uniref:Uncharacterized protein n=1 Tax=Rhizophora mucronata TaxID=61149 RepID=A0A2P2NRU5_RHIMU